MFKNRKDAGQKLAKALPLFLIWLQMSWLVVLFGAEISFAHQNVETYEFEPDCLKVSPRFKKLLSLRVVNFLVKNFQQEESAKLTDSKIAKTLEIPVRLIRELLYQLEKAHILSEVKNENGESISYQPAIEPYNLTIKKVLDAMERQGTDNIPVAQTEELEKISQRLKEFDEIIRKSPANILLKDI